MASLFNTRISDTYVGLIKSLDNSAISATLKQLSDGSGNSLGIYVNTSGDFKVNGILEWGSLKDTGEDITITKFVDEADGIANNDNDTTIPTSAAIIDYVSSQITLEDLDFSGDSGSGSVDLDSQTFAIVGTTNEIETSASNQQLQIGIVTNPTLSGNVTITGDLNISQGEIINIGTDFDLYETATGAYIQYGTNPVIFNGNADVIFRKQGSEEKTAVFTPQGSAKLYYDNSLKLETTTNGLTVTGITDTDGITSSAEIDVDLASEGTYFEGGSGNIRRLSITSGTNISAHALHTFNINSSNGKYKFDIGGTEEFSIALGNASLAGNLTIAGDLTVNGTTTTFYGDITLDSDTKRLKLGDSQDLQLYHDGNNSYISEQGTGELKLLASSVAIQSATGNEYIAYFAGTGGQTASLYAGNSKKFETTSTGISVTGVAVADGLDMGDDEKIRLGASQDLEIYHDGSHSYIDETGTGGLIVKTGDLYLRNPSNADYIYATSGGAVNLYHNGSKKFETTSTGVTVTGSANISSDLILSDYGSGTHTGTATQRLGVDSSGNVIEIPIGAGAVDGSGTAGNITKWIDTDTIGNSIITESSNLIQIGSISSGSLNEATGVKLAIIGDSGGTNDGLIITRDNGSQNQLDQFINIFNDGTSIFLTSGGTSTHGTFDFRSTNDKGDTSTSRLSIDASGNSTFAGFVKAPFFTSDGGRGFKQDGVSFVSTYSNGADANDANDIGSSSNKWRDAYFSGQLNSATISTTGNATFAGDVLLSDSGELQLGTDNDSQIYNNGSHLFIDNGTGNSYLRNTSTGSIILRNSTGGDIQFDNEFAGNILFNTSNIERMRLDSSGRLGLGVTSPSSYNSRGQDLVIKKTGANVGISIVAEPSGGTNYSSSLVFADGTGGTAGYRGILEYSHEYDAFTFSTSATTALTIDSSQNVGIGTTSPDTLLELSKAVGTGTSLVKLTNSSSPATSNIAQIDFELSNSFSGSNVDVQIGAIKTNAGNEESAFFIKTTSGTGTPTERMRLDSNGVLQLTETSASGFLNANGTSLELDVNRNPETGAFGDVNKSHARISLTGSDGGSIIAFNTSSANNTVATERMRLDSDGALSFSTSSTLSSAIASLQHYATNGYLYIKGGTGGLIIGDDGTDSRIQIEDNSNIRFETAGSERARITSGGDVLVGSSESTSTVSTSTGLKLFNSNSSTAGRIDFRKTYSGATNVTANYHAGTYVGGVVASNTATSYETSSDYRLKEDLKDFNALEIASKIKMYDFKWKADDSRSYGVMAHELQEVLPQAVTGEKDAEEMQGVDYSKLVPILLKSIQELKAEIDELKNNV